MITYDFKLPFATILLNELLRMNKHVRREHCRMMAWQVALAIGRERHKHQPLKFSKIIVERTSPRRPDWDGLYGGLKPLLDVLVIPTKRNPHGIGIIKDDSPSWLLELTAVPKVGKDFQTRVVITGHH